MTLRVPLSVRADEKHITREVSAVQFRKEAIGGVKSISLRLARSLDRFDPDLSALSKIYLYDARSATTIAEGRLTDFGRSASNDGQQWDIVAFGPAQHAADATFPYIVVDQSLEPFRRSLFSVRNATTDRGEVDADTPALEIRGEEGKTINTSWIGDMINRSIRDAGQKLARVSATIDAGLTSANYRQQIVTRTGAGGASIKDTTASTSASTLTAVVVTDFPDGDDVVSVRAVRDTSTVPGADTHWFMFYNLKIRAMLKTSAGADITTGYTANTVLAHEVVNDLLGRVLDQYDGAGASVDTGGTYTIDQMSYPDGVTAEQVLTDLMTLEPAYRWTADPDTTGNGYAFSWEPWPTTVRYEATLEDGGEFPTSAQELYNQVTVRWRQRDGLTKATTVTGACQILDDAGLTRSTTIDASDEIGSSAGATRVGQNFLAEHSIPANAGSLTITRPVRDLTLGCMVEPFEIEPGELIRVRGIESYTDALNASDKDGLTVFRIWSMTYASNSNSATLELDTWGRTTVNALRNLAKRRNRKR